MLMRNDYANEDGEFYASCEGKENIIQWTALAYSKKK